MRPIKGGKDDRDHAQKLRRRVKKGTASDEDRAWLDAWDARVATMPKGRPVGSGKNDSQSAAETPAEGGAGNSGDEVSPSVDPSKAPDPAPPVKSDPVPAPPPLEAPPPIAAPPPAAAASGGDWRDKHRRAVHFSDDGRQMLCEQLAHHICAGLGALVDDMKKADITPLIDPRAIESMYVLALDELLPARARLTPKVGAVLVTTATVGQRAYHHKKITEALKDDPEVKAWKRKQAEREERERMQHEQHLAEVKQAQQTHADPTPPPAAAERPVNGQPFAEHTRAEREPLRDDGTLLI